jgi:hypothetical protein
VPASLAGPVLVVSADAFNRSRVKTPGNITLVAATAGLDRDCLVNFSPLVTVDKTNLETRLGRLVELTRFSVLIKSAVKGSARHRHHLSQGSSEVGPLWWTPCGLTATVLAITSCVAA